MHATLRQAEKWGVRPVSTRVGRVPTPADLPGDLKGAERRVQKWRLTPVIQALGRQKDRPEFKVSLGYKMKPCLKQTNLKQSGAEVQEGRDQKS